MNKLTVAALLCRLDDQAQEQLCAEVARLAGETELLREQLVHMESCAEGWREDAMALHEQLAAATGGEAGITQAGEPVVVAHIGADLEDADAPLSAEDAAWLDAWLAQEEACPAGERREMHAHG